MNQHPLDLLELAKEFGDRWVAIDPDDRSVIASGESAKEVLDAAISRGVKMPLVIHVAKDFGWLAPAC